MVDCEFEGVAGYVENERATRKWKMTGSYPFNYESYYNGLMTDWGAIFSIYLFLLVRWIGARNLSVNKFWKTLSRVRVCVRALQEFSSFCCHKCHTLWSNSFITNLLRWILCSIKEIACFCRNKASKRCVSPRKMSLRIWKTSTHFT